jgi:hypothetical protein
MPSGSIAGRNGHTTNITVIALKSDEWVDAARKIERGDANWKALSGYRRMGAG